MREPAAAPVRPTSMALHPAAFGGCIVACLLAASACGSGSAQSAAVPVTAAAAWFARHVGVAVRSGPVTLHVVQGPDRTWQVDSGSWCS